MSTPAATNSNTPSHLEAGHARESSLLEMPLTKAIFRLAWPTMASLMVVNLFNLVDAYWVAKLGTHALGGMTASAFLVWCLHSVGMLVGTGVNALVAQRIGAGRRDLAGLAGAHGLLVAALLALVALLIGLTSQDWLFSAMGLSTGAQSAAIAYLTPVLYGLPAITCWYAVEAIFRGYGDTKTPMWVLCISLLINTVLDPMLIFGLGPFPALGIVGAAWATVLAHLFAFFGCLFLLRKTPVRPWMRQDGRLLLSAKMLWSIFKVGTPVAASAFLFSVIYIFLTKIIAEFGGAAVAAVGVGHRVEGLGYYVCVGFAVASSTLVGQNLGAKNTQRAERAAWRTTGYATVVVGILSVATYLLAEPIMAAFTDDARVVAQGASYLRIVAILEVGMAFEVVLEGAFAGAGNSLPPMLVSVPLTALRIPLAYLLAKTYGLGIAGIWWAVSISTGLKGLLIGAWFRWGRWRGKAL
jgi:putative MATE family efflux protein